MPLEGDSRNPLTYLIYDLMTGDVLAELPFTGVTFSQRLNTPGAFNGNLDFLDPKVASNLPGAILQPGRTCIFIDYQGVLLWGGIIWTVNFARSTASSVSIAAREFWSYFAMRIQAADYTATWLSPGDPMVIAAQVVSDAIESSASAFGAFTGFPLTINQNNGVATPETYWQVESYPYSQLQTVDTIVANLTVLGYNVGFDFAIDVAYDSFGNPELTMNMSYPRRGRVAGSSSVVIVTQESHEYTYPQDSTAQATTIYATGSGSGTQAIVANPAPITAGWPLLELVNSYTNLTNETVLATAAYGDLNTQSWPISTPTVTIPMFGDPLPFEYGIGDDIRWIIEPDERFPEGVEFNWRISGIDFAVVEEGISKAVLTFDVPPGTGALEPPT